MLSRYYVPGTVFGGLCVRVRDAGGCACVCTSVMCVAGGVMTGDGARLRSGSRIFVLLDACS